MIFWRVETRLKQGEIADRLGITKAHYSNLERGISDPSYNLLLDFRKEFNIQDVFGLFEKEGDEWQQ